MLNPLLFMALMEALTSEGREGFPWELLHVDDLRAPMELKKKELRWKECTEARAED